MNAPALQPIISDIFLLSGDGYPKVCSNAYVLEGPDALALIDSGVDAPRLQASLKHLGKPVETALFTHGHFDHVTAAIKAEMNGNMAAEDLDVIDQLNAAWVKIKKPAFFEPFLGKRIDFADFQLDIIPTPGHTPGSVSYFERKRGILFSGDCKFANGGVGRTDFWGGDPQTLEESLAKIDTLDFKLLAPGHGPLEKKQSLNNEVSGYGQTRLKKYEGSSRLVRVVSKQA